MKRLQASTKLEREYQRLKVTFQKTDIDELMQQIKEINTDLQ